MWAHVGEDEPRQEIVELARLYYKQGYYIIVLSGRDGVCYRETEKWLVNYKVPFNDLLMRTENDNRKDYIIKYELFNGIRSKFAIKLIVDDRPQVINMWRSMGITVLDCGNGIEF
jgi:hypothetical protein